MNRYETIFIIDPNVETEDAEGIIEDVQNLISGSGGQVSKVDNWGKRRLAYEVKGNRDGIYVLVRFESDPQFIQRLARYYGLTEQVIKYMTVRADDLPEFTGEKPRVERRPLRGLSDRDEADEDEDEEDEDDEDE